MIITINFILMKVNWREFTWGSLIGNGRGNEVSLTQKAWVQILCYPLGRGEYKFLGVVQLTIMNFLL